jgi:UDP-N-acetylglucosamine--N-acetylmuramyl-(pentapeptide) pyrophosphoryl-undecaprenol N-acetylglucosamine transferase
MASKIALGLPGGEAYFSSGRTTLTGNPIRREIELLAERDPPERGGTFTLLILGGSQGARALNEAVLQALPCWAKAKPPLRIIHVTGEGDLERLREAYGKWGIEAEVSSFIWDMAGTYRRADLALARSGALTVSELTAVGCPALLVPLSTQGGSHQAINARYLAERGGALLIPEGELRARLAETVLTLGSDPIRLQEMARASRSLYKPGASRRIVDLLLGVARGR